MKKDSSRSSHMNNFDYSKSKCTVCINARNSEMHIPPNLQIYIQSFKLIFVLAFILHYIKAKQLDYTHHKHLSLIMTHSIVQTNVKYKEKLVITILTNINEKY